MTQEIKKAPDITFQECERITEFFKGAGLLTRACRETGLELINVRRNLAGPANGIKLAYVVYLGAWMRLWESQETERKAIVGKIQGTEK